MKSNTKKPIITLEDAIQALERKRKEITRLRNQNNHLKALVDDLTRKLSAPQ